MVRRVLTGDNGVAILKGYVKLSALPTIDLYRGLNFAFTRLIKQLLAVY